MKLRPMHRILAKAGLLSGFARLRQVAVRGSQGFSIVEVLLAAVVFGVLATGLVGALVYGREGTATAGDRTQALALAEEGIEAARNIRDANFALLTTGDHGVVVTVGPATWGFSGSFDDTTVNSITYRRVVNVALVSGRKDVTSTVSWSTGAASRSVSSSTRLTDWRAAFTTGPIMMAYSKTTTTPFYRTWNGTTWSAEGSANAVVGNINYVVLKSSRTRNEAILGTQTSTGAIYIQIWNGSTWGAATLVGTGTTTTRSFDISYEKKNDRAVIAYLPSAASADFAYRTWDGTTLSGGTTVTAPPTTGVMNWIEMKQNPLSTSDDIALISLDANADVYGMMWDGSAWGTMGTAAVWDASAATATKKAIDVEFEQITGRAMFMWGDSVATDQFYRIWNGTTLTTATLLDITNEGGVAEWIQLASRPNSNEIMLGVQDAGADLNTTVWNGISAWGAATEHSAATENILSRNFDIAWETWPHVVTPGRAYLVWGDGATVSRKQWGAGAWGGAVIATGSDDTAFVRLRADPVSGALFSVWYEDSTSATDDILESRLTGGSSTWTANTSIWAGPTGTSPVFFRIDIATP